MSAPGVRELLRRLGTVLQDNVIAERHGRPVLAVKAGAVSQVPGQVHDSSASGSTLFVEPRSVLSIGNRLVDLEARRIAYYLDGTLQSSSVFGDTLTSQLALDEELYACVCTDGRLEHTKFELRQGLPLPLSAMLSA